MKQSGLLGATCDIMVGSFMLGCRDVRILGCRDVRILGCRDLQFTAIVRFLLRTNASCQCVCVGATVVCDIFIIFIL